MAGVRTVTGITWLASDHHGTTEATISNTDLTVSRRRTLPFGEARGTITGAWPTAMDKGFVGGTIDNTGLTHLGAREYDPKLGRFVSVDPVMDLTDPQQMHGYSYANNNPVTMSDPTGLIPEDCNHVDCDYSPGCETCNQDKKKDNPCYPAKSCDSTSRNNPDRGGERHPETGYSIPPRGQVTLELYVEVFYGRHISDLNAAEIHEARWGVFCYNFPDICRDMREEADRQFNEFFLDLVGYTDAENCVKGSAGGCVLTVIGVVPVGKLKVAGKLGEALWDTARVACSFSGETEVLMADGTTKPIKNIKIDDKVIATDPETGEEGPRTVTHLWIHEDRLVDLKLANGEAVTTTEDHPFWNDTDREWQRAQELGNGERLRTRSGEQVSVIGLNWKTLRVDMAYNLSVDDIHAYYVIVGGAAVLVHNTNTCTTVPWLSGNLPAAEEVALNNTLAHIDAGTVPTGPTSVKWGSQFKNWNGDLPGIRGQTSPYREYRVAPPPGVGGAGPLRVVVDSVSGATYYTWTHYGDSGSPAFVRLR